MRLRSKAAREKITPVPEIGFGQPVSDRGPGLLRNFELDRPPGFPLDHGGPLPRPATGAHVLDFQRDEVAAAQLAVDRQVEQGEVALLTPQVEAGPELPRYPLV